MDVRPRLSWPAVMLSLLVVPASAAGAGRGDVFGPLDLLSGDVLFAAATGDLNADGIADLAVASYGSDSVIVHFGNSETHAYDRHVSYALSPAPTKPAIADIDSDGDLDLLVGHLGGTTVSLLRNLGDGTFGAVEPIPCGSGPVWIELADLNEDDLPDLVAANIAGGGVSVALNDGQGGFDARVFYGAGSAPWSVVVEDFDGDGLNDVGVASINSNRITILTNQGGGALGGRIDYDLFDGPISLEAIDFDEDGDVDLAVVNHFGESLRLFVNDSGAFTTGESFPLGQQPRHVAAADLNVDGHVDLAVAVTWDDTVSIFMSDGAGSFAPAVEYNGGNFPYTVTIADHDADGLPDLAVPNEGGYVRLFFNRGGGTFSTQPTHDVYQNVWAPSVELYDVNDDQCADLFVVAEADAITVRLNQGDGTFAPPVLETVGDQPQEILAGDVDGDTDPDLIIPNRSNQTISRLRNRGGGDFGANVEFPAGANPAGAALADMDGDGDLDVIVAVSFPDMNVSVLLNNGNGAFDPPLTYPVGVRLDDVVAADFNGDGLPDVAYRSIEEHNIGVLLNVGGGVLGAPTIFTPGARPHDFELGDIDGDGDLDIAVTSGLADSLDFLLNDGAGDFSTLSRILLGGYGSPEPAGLALGDVDGDGDLDFIVTDDDSDIAIVGLNDGDGGFFAFTTLDDLYAAQEAALGDIDADGDLDLAVGIALHNTVAVIRNEGAVSASQPAPLTDLVVFGDILSGGFQDILHSDDFRLTVQSRPGFLVTEPAIVHLTVGAASPIIAPATIDLTYEGRISQPGGIVFVELKNWSTGQFDEVGSFAIGMTEEVEQTIGVPAADHVRVHDNRIEVRYRIVVVNLFQIAGFSSNTDQIAVQITE